MTEAQEILLAFDFGLKRIGIASGNFLTRTASPVTTLNARSGVLWNDLDRLLDEWHPQLLVVGLPSGTGETRDHAGGPGVRRGARSPLRARGRDRRRIPDLARGAERAQRGAPLRLPAAAHRQGPRRHASRLSDRGTMDERNGLTMQVNDKGQLRHLLTLAELERSQIERIIDKARAYLDAARPPGAAGYDLARADGRKPVLRGQHAHARIVRARRKAAQRRRAESRRQDVLAHRRARASSTRSSRCRLCRSTSSWSATRARACRR